ncbi:MAG: hypothetical protein AB7I04_09435 [Pseudomonadales bacterium]
MKIAKHTTLCQPAVTALLCLLLVFAQPAGGAGTPGDGVEQAPDGQTPDEAALTYYREGLAHKETALALEAAAAATTDEDERARLLDEARAAYQAAVQVQGRALKLDLDYVEAANELGFALRSTGDYRKALGAYNFALEIRPDFYPAIEYRGEAYLALGMLTEAKDAYLMLFRNDLALAARLLDAMAAADTNDAEFRAWVLERQRLAAVTPGAADAASSW